MAEKKKQSKKNPITQPVAKSWNYLSDEEFETSEFLNERNKVYLFFSDDESLSDDDNDFTEQNKTENENESEKTDDVVLNGERISLPSTLFQTDLSQILNQETWNSLDQQEKLELQKYLPIIGNPETTVQKLFSGENLNFSEPIKKFEKDLKRGFYHSKATKYRETYLKLEKENHCKNLHIYHNNMIATALAYRSEIGLDNSRYSEYNYEKALEEENITKSDRSKHLSKKEKSALKQASKESKKKQKESAKAKAKGKITGAKRKRKTTGDTGPNKKLKPNPDLPPEPVYYLFRGIQKVILSKDGVANLDDFVEYFQNDEIIVSQVPPFYSIQQFLWLALHFLTTENLRIPPILSTIQQFSPITKWNEEKKGWEWVCVEPTSEPDVVQQVLETGSTREIIEYLEQLFFFGVSRQLYKSEISAIELLQTENDAKQKSIVTVIPLDEKDVEEYRRQETLRYKTPEKPYIYDVGNVKTIVSALKRPGGSAKAREHPLLNPNRPANVNLLCLVRDAVSRLPGSIGTRADISLLLKNSQFIIPTVPENQINTVISGCLDRLHSEKDPCVKFDSDQKLWIYLHRSRKLSSFPVRATPKRAQAKSQRAKNGSKPKTTISKATSPNSDISSVQNVKTPNQQTNGVEQPVQEQPVQVQSVQEPIGSNSEASNTFILPSLVQITDTNIADTARKFSVASITDPPE